MDDTLKRIETYIIWAVAFLLPLIIIPMFPNSLTTGKLIVLVFGILSIFLVKAIRVIATQKLEIKTGRFDFPIIIFLLSYFISAILRSPNKMEAFFLPGTATLIIGAAIFYFLANQLEKEAKNNVLISFVSSAVILAVTSSLSISGAISKISILPEEMKSSSFTLLGSNLPVIVFLGVCIPLVLGFAAKTTDNIRKVFFTVILFVITVGIAANLYNILPGKPSSPKFPDYATSWSVTVDALKESPVLGMGPANYPTAFNKYRPITYNSTPIWSLRFMESRSFVLNVLTEAGFLGFSALIILGFLIYGLFTKERKEMSLVGWGMTSSPELITLVVSFLVLFVFGAEIALLTFFFSLLAVNTKANNVVLNFQTQGGEGGSQKLASILPSSLVALPIIGLVIVVGFFASKSLVAEATYMNALKAVAANNGSDAYTLMGKAINLSPKVDRYHASYAQVNYALANSIAPKAEGETVTDQERDTITQLIQQAIEQGKATVTLNPQRASNWSILAGIYRSIMAFSQGADQFAIQSYTQAVSLDPLDTNLRISLGGVYYALGDYDNAIDTFKLAVLTKPDFANARYNLAVAYREKGELEKAIAEMTVVLSLVDKNSNDYETAKKELEALEAKRPINEGESEKKSETLTTPEQNQESVVEPPIELPSEAEPPITETPSPVPSASPIPTIEP